MPQVGRLENVGIYSIFFYSLASLYSHQPRFGQWNMIHSRNDLMTLLTVQLTGSFQKQVSLPEGKKVGPDQQRMPRFFTPRLSRSTS